MWPQLGPGVEERVADEGQGVGPGVLSTGPGLLTLLFADSLDGLDRIPLSSVGQTSP